MPRRIEIQLTAAAPPTGTARRLDAMDTRRFVGWLDLLRVLAELVAAADEHPERGP